MSKIPAAAIPEKSRVRIPDETPHGQGFMDVTIVSVENSTPRPGQITWHTEFGLKVIIGASIKIEVLQYPHEREDKK